MQSFFFYAHERCFNCLDEEARRFARSLTDRQGAVLPGAAKNSKSKENARISRVRADTERLDHGIASQQLVEGREFESTMMQVEAWIRRLLTLPLLSFIKEVELSRFAAAG